MVSWSVSRCEIGHRCSVGTRDTTFTVNDGEVRMRPGADELRRREPVGDESDSKSMKVLRITMMGAMVTTQSRPGEASG